MENSTALASTHEDGKGETARLHYHSFEAWREKHWQHYQEKSVHKVITYLIQPPGEADSGEKVNKTVKLAKRHVEKGELVGCRVMSYRTVWNNETHLEVL